MKKTRPGHFAVHKPTWFLLVSTLLIALTSFADEIASTRPDLLPESGLVLSIDVDGSITPFMQDYIRSAIYEAESKRAQALLINLDTPGGLYETTREIVKDILASAVPVIVYVTPSGARAGSAGVFIALSANITAMALSTNIGAAHPVDSSGGNVEGDMREKITNDAKAWARSIAETRGKNADWAERAVVGSQSISAAQAAELKVIDFVAADVDEVLAKAHGRQVVQGEKTITLSTKNAKIVTYGMNFQQAFMKFLANPNLLYIFMLLGFLGIIIEFQFPGLIFPGLLGVLLLAVVFGVQVLPINWFGALLIFGAAALFIAEIFITSFGLLGIGGLVLLIMGSYLLFSVEGSSNYVEPLIIWLLSGGFALIMVVIGLVLLRARLQKPTSNVYALVGTIGTVTEAIMPPHAGYVRLFGTLWRAHADEPIDVGHEVVVKKIVSTIIFVDKK